MIIDPQDPQIENKLLAQERIFDQLRITGEMAQATILRVTDTGIRIGDTASMLQFGLMVFPTNRPSFEAESNNSISDASRPKFVTDATVYVKFNPNDMTLVAIDHAALSTPSAKVVVCKSCGATQTLTEGQAACSFCGSPLQ